MNGAEDVGPSLVGRQRLGREHRRVLRRLPQAAGAGRVRGDRRGARLTSETRRPSFTDATVPASAASQGAQYIVQGFRGTRVGDASDAVTVQFGTDGNGFATAALKMAA